MYGPEGVTPELVERGRRIPTLTPISDGTSAAVRSMYEENPYPLWRRLSRTAPLDLDQKLRLLVGGEWDSPGFLKRPRLLVAGCGTGRDMLSAACAWRPATVTGFDLSRTSLVCAQEMAERLGVEVELYHADLLRLGGWERQFDVIMCTGVLHHLADPLAGWRILLKLLRPGGVLATFSCSGLMTPELFHKVVSDAAVDAKRDVQVIARLQQAEDHPEGLCFPEGLYLKGLLCRAW